MPERGPCPLWVKSRHVQRNRRCPLSASGHCQGFLPKFLLGVANSLNAHSFARIAPELLDVLINER